MTDAQSPIEAMCQRMPELKGATIVDFVGLDGWMQRTFRLPIGTYVNIEFSNELGAKLGKSVAKKRVTVFEMAWRQLGSGAIDSKLSAAEALPHGIKCASSEFCDRVSELNAEFGVR
jgi:hypothetical protein